MARRTVTLWLCSNVAVDSFGVVVLLDCVEAFAYVASNLRLSVKIFLIFSLRIELIKSLVLFFLS